MTTVRNTGRVLAALLWLGWLVVTAEANMDRKQDSVSAASDALGWRTVNDNVMGGRSEGGFSINGDTLLFRGSTNTNGGGFSSIRSMYQPLDLAERDGIELELRGDGRTYTFRLETADRVAWWATFETASAASGETLRIPFSEFVPRWRGRRLTGPQLDTSNIVGLGIMIYDGRDGPFSLEVERIGAW